MRREPSRDRWGRFCRSLPEPPRPNPLRFPTEQHPRYRLRVFDRCWPWRASRGEAMRDALASRNAHRYPVDRQVYLDASAVIQRDPPPYLELLRARMRRGEV